jgi:predicted glycosyltransferase involved in capsule biosynthesis
MKFWDDGQPNSTRIRNVKYCWEELKKFTKFLNDNNVNVVCNLYDFSVEKIMEESRHFSYPLGVYKKAEKTNIILKEQKDYDFFMMVDCDAFFYKEDYIKFLDLFNSLNDGDVVTFDLAKLEDRIQDFIIDGEFVLENADWSYAYSGKRELGPLKGYMGGLGGVYLCYTNLLTELGGFDEKYVGWGGEDGEMFSRIWESQIKHKFIPVNHFAPFHLPHFSDWGSINYSKRFEIE